MKNNTINNMILFLQSKKINGYDCHDCHVLSLIGGEKGITLLSVGILRNSDLWSLYKFLKDNKVTKLIFLPCSKEQLSSDE